MLTCDVDLRPCTSGDLGALEAWAPTGNSRTHAMRFSHQEAGTSTYYLATCRSDPSAVVDPRPKHLYRRLGYVDTGCDYLDRYTWIDESGDEHHVAEPARWMMKPLGDDPSVA